MANYIPPDNTSISFDFTQSGYVPPNFDSIDFSSNSAINSLANVQSSINVLQLYRETTHTYVKECRAIITGYSSGGIQTLKLPCLYGGIRDIAAVLTTQPQNLDLQAYIFATEVVLPTGTKDIISMLRPTREGSYNFYTWFRESTRSIVNLEGYVKFIQGSKVTSNLAAYVTEAVQPINIHALLNVIELRNLESTIEGVRLKSSVDLAASFHKVYTIATNTLLSYIHGWAIADLKAEIKVFQLKDLRVDINAGFFAIHKNLYTYIQCIKHENVHAYLHGYDTLNLQAIISIGYKDTDLQAHLTTIQPRDLNAYIDAFLGRSVSYDLIAYIKGFFISDFKAYINTIEYKSLKVYIDAVGKYLDLIANIYPRTINIKRMLLIPLFEHKDLKATINYNCLKSGYKDLQSYIYLLSKKDLKAHIIGWLNGGADTVIDLKACINCIDYKVCDHITISGYPTAKLFSLYDIKTTPKKRYRVFDTFNISGGKELRTVKAYITGVQQHTDLQVAISAKPIANFSTSPDWVNPKTLEVVINLNSFEERWQRFVELLFFTNSEEDFHYFYVSGEDKIYKVDRDRTWQLHVTGYTEDKGSLFNKIKINKKFAFNLKNYNYIDSAITDLIDRVSVCRTSDLPSYIIVHTLSNADLGAHIKIKHLYTWSSDIRTVIRGTSTGQLSMDAFINATI